MERGGVSDKIAVENTIRNAGREEEIGGERGGASAQGFLFHIGGRF